MEVPGLVYGPGRGDHILQLIGLRKRIMTGKATKEERQAYQEMKDVLELEQPDTRTLEEKEQEAEFLQAGRGKQKETTCKQKLTLRS